ncbi:MAG: D-2-hydroxyacid dehydrogenase [Chloroflexi bacterium]|nr:D-2-hydroxyacid dehydrogenase [Chloroflexota bacterium]
MPLKVLIASYLEPEHIDRIRQAVPQVEVVYRPNLIGAPLFQAHHTAVIERSAEQEAEWLALLAQADILFDFDHTHREDLPQLAHKLKWIQTTSAGIGQFVKTYGYDRQGWIFTTASGVHARPLAEFCLMAMLTFVKNFRLMDEQKRGRHWQRFHNTELRGMTVGILGLGKIGRDLAAVCRFFGMRIIATRRDARRAVDSVDLLFAPSQLEEVLPQVDFLVLCLPHTPETDGLLDAERIAMLKQGAFLINIARGALVDQVALTDALIEGRLGGAALDVTDPEPLPEDDPLWDLPNVIISHHSASTADTENGKLTDLFIRNLRRYLAGEPMENLLDLELMY